MFRGERQPVVRCPSCGLVFVQQPFYFSRRTVSRLLTETGFEVSSVGYPWKLVPSRLLLFQISPRLKAASASVGRLPLGLYVHLFDAMLVIVRKSDG